MRPQIVAHDGFVKAFHAVRDGDGARRRFRAAQRALVAFIGMVVGVDFGIVAEQNEQIAVTAPGEAHLGFLAQHLPATDPPGLGVLPGRIRSVIVVGAEGFVHIRHRQIGRAPAGDDVSARCEVQVAVIAVRHEAGGKIARETELLANWPERVRNRRALLVDAVVAHGGAQAQFQILRWRRDDVDHAADRI